VNAEAIQRRLKREYPAAGETELADRYMSELLALAATKRAEAATLGTASSRGAHEGHALLVEARELEGAAFAELRRRSGTSTPAALTGARYDGMPPLSRVSPRV
jgi:hypothetical protein